MSPWAATLTVIFAVIGMEIFAWAIHKYVMHGPGWGWHESHHTETKGLFETNDLYAVVFSVFAAGLFIVGSLWWTPLWFVALGLTVYGLLYGFVHDGLVHQRWPFFVKTRGFYMKRLVQAHRIHHAVHTRDGAVSFGFLWAEDIRKLKVKLKSAADQ
ncbi:sterol desaturase family protein [Algimonas arctica]|uniref:sterol desaturase family protein n=1 Tax=Algimonas arctica TaxID=1479486 RepID=UPI001671B358|nr:sterol desaturase family protein [Algimonas arctica]